MIRFVCSCGKRLKVPSGKAGWRCTCPACKRNLTIPEELPSSVGTSAVTPRPLMQTVPQRKPFDLGPNSPEPEIDASLASYNLLPGAAGLVKRAIRAGTFRGFQAGVSFSRSPRLKQPAS
jgi:hypothetical protein